MKKRLIVCCDGTWNREDQEKNDTPTPTNVVRMAYRIAKQDGEDQVPQILFYEHGVGTGGGLDRLSGGAFGDGLDDNIFNAYRFLIANYQQGDELFLFGFSRGAFTVRSLAGLIRNCGILKRVAVLSYRAALAMYQNAEIHPNSDAAKEFRNKNSIGGDGNVPIHFIGVWDTVGALGIPLRGLRGVTRRKYQFHDIQLSSQVRHVYHALAVDEWRAPFVPSLFWQEAQDRANGQVLEQVWFPGVHSDIGGGYEERNLSDIALDWMIDKASGCGLAFDRATMAEYPTEPKATGTLHVSKKGLYVVTKGVDRAIGLRPADPKDATKASTEPDPSQSLHPSVQERWDADSSYRPKGLREFFARTAGG